VPAFGGYSFSSTVNLGPHWHHSLSGMTSITRGTWSPQPNHEVLAIPESAKSPNYVTMMVSDRRPTYSRWGMYLSCTFCLVSDLLGTVYWSSEVVVFDVVSCLSRATRLQITQSARRGSRIRLRPKRIDPNPVFAQVYIHVCLCKYRYIYLHVRYTTLPDVTNLHVGYSCYLKGTVLTFFLGTSRQQCEYYEGTREIILVSRRYIVLM
jgi:hypothetical protein